MAAGITYTPLATTTLGSNTASVTFSSIPSTYTDLVLICSTASATAGGNELNCQVNSDTGSNYSFTYVLGNGSSAASGRGSNQTRWAPGEQSASFENPTLMYFFNYSNTTTYKTMLSRRNTVSNLTSAFVNLWRSTSAINSIYLYNASGHLFLSGSTFTLYGIKAA